MNEPQSPNKAHNPRGPFTASDLPLDDQGRIYHLQLKPDQIAPDIILVGDPGRARFIGSNFLRDLSLEHEHRGLVTITGTSEVTGQPATIISPLETTVATSGMGTPSLEVVIGELVALNEIDLVTRTRRSEYPRLHVLRVGTSGAMQADTRLGTPIITSYAIGMDNTGLFYEAAYPDEITRRLEGELGQVVKAAMPVDSRFHGKVHPYVGQAAPALVAALVEAAGTLGVETRLGLTVSNCGFFSPQGRDIARIRPSIPDLDQVFADYDPQVGGQRVENMEMEASFLIHYLGGLGYWAGAICPAIANRRADTFDPNYQQAVENTIRIALLALANLRERSQGVMLG